MSAAPGLKVVVRGLISEARIGVPEEERAVPQRLRLDLELEVTPPRELGPSFSDELDEVYDYGRLRDRLHRLCRENEARLLETLADRIARDCLEDSRVRRVRVRIEKPDIFDDSEGVGVEVERQNPPR